MVGYKGDRDRVFTTIPSLSQPFLFFIASPAFNLPSSVSDRRVAHTSHFPCCASNPGRDIATRSGLRAW